MANSLDLVDQELGGGGEDADHFVSALGQLEAVPDAEVVDLRSLRPLDLDTYVASVKKTNRAVVVEEGDPVEVILLDSLTL